MVGERPVKVVKSLTEAGLYGIEAVTYSYAKREESNICVKTGMENNLLIFAERDLDRNIEDVSKFLLSYEIFLGAERSMPSQHIEWDVYPIKDIVAELTCD